MINQVQYVTDEDGKRVGVLLDVQSYQQMLVGVDDPDLLPGLSRDELVALAETKLTSGDQDRLEYLLAANKSQTISEAETEELDAILERIDYLNIIKARALYTLQQMNENASA